MSFGHEIFFADRGGAAGLYHWLLRELRSTPATYQLIVFREGRLLSLKVQYLPAGTVPAAGSVRDQPPEVRRSDVSRWDGSSVNQGPVQYRLSLTGRETHASALTIVTSIVTGSPSFLQECSVPRSTRKSPGFSRTSSRSTM